MKTIIPKDLSTTACGICAVAAALVVSCGGPSLPAGPPQQSASSAESQPTSGVSTTSANNNVPAPLAPTSTVAPAAAAPALVPPAALTGTPPAPAPALSPTQAPAPSPVPELTPAPAPAPVYSTCAAILAANPSSADGVYTLTPGGAGSAIGSGSYYCDMTYNGGGWTLIASNNGTGNTPVVDSLSALSTAGLLNSTIVVALATSSSSVRISSGVPSASTYVISASTFPITQLRSYKLLNNQAFNNGAAPTDWTLSANASPSQVKFSCTPNGGYSAALSTTIFHACNYGNGIQWTPSTSTAGWTVAGPSQLSLWVK